MSYEVTLFHWNGIPVLTIKGEGNTEQAIEELGQKVYFLLQEGKKDFIFYFPQGMGFDPCDFGGYMAIAGVYQIIDGGGRVNLVVTWDDLVALHDFTELCRFFVDLNNAIADLVAYPSQAGEICKMSV